jgi:hypothetical protein
VTPCDINSEHTGRDTATPTLNEGPLHLQPSIPILLDRIKQDNGLVPTMPTSIRMPMIHGTESTAAGCTDTAQKHEDNQDGEHGAKQSLMDDGVCGLCRTEPVR